jgi:hypothetical protein
VLSRREVEPRFSRGGVALVDSESGEELRLRWNERRRRAYQESLERHNRELKSFCHQSGIDYSLFVTDGDLSDFVLTTLPSIGLFK